MCIRGLLWEDISSTKVMVSETSGLLFPLGDADSPGDDVVQLWIQRRFVIVHALARGCWWTRI